MLITLRRPASVLAILALCGTSPLLAQDSSQSHAITLAAANDEWTSTGLKVNVGDLVVIFAGGKITAGGFVGEVDANGRDKTGTDVKLGFIEGKVGTGAPFRVGQRFPFQPEAAGTLKLRVADTRYDDNRGSYSVTIIVIPASHLPTPTPYASDD